ncbi:hypothetical protein M0802_003886 [Mischocyttarus mexicanus]|nr:hypothetical protein M0802_003886 [Mischocyttarus mexicanus]
MVLVDQDSVEYHEPCFALLCYALLCRWWLMPNCCVRVVATFARKFIPILVGGR